MVRLRTRTASECTVSEIVVERTCTPLTALVTVRMKDWSTVAGSMNLKVAGFELDELTAPGTINAEVIVMG